MNSFCEKAISLMLGINVYIDVRVNENKNSFESKFERQQQQRRTCFKRNWIFETVRNCGLYLLSRAYLHSSFNYARTRINIGPNAFDEAFVARIIQAVYIYIWPKSAASSMIDACFSCATLMLVVRSSTGCIITARSIVQYSEYSSVVLTMHRVMMQFNKCRPVFFN